MFEYPFIDREEELGVLRDYAENGFYPVLFIYGPEGCGKTRLLREFISSIEEPGDYITVYLDAQSVGSFEEAVCAPPVVLETFSTAAGAISEPVGRFVARVLPLVVKKVFERKLRGRRVVIAVDDVARPLGVDVIESYAKKLLDLLEWLMARGAESVLIIATTSEGSSPSILARHSYVVLSELWNLSRDSTEKLLEALNAPEKLYEKVWVLTGGNPRAVISIAAKRWKVDVWFSEVVRNVRLSSRSIVFRYRSQLRYVVEDIDRVIEFPDLEKGLIEANLIVPVNRPCLGYTPLPDEELGIGEYYAWQIPAYRSALRECL